jgi:hypothetical protein
VTYTARVTTPDRAALVAAVQRALDETEAEYARMPMVVRLLVRRGFVKRTGLDFPAWRSLLARSHAPELAPRLAGLAEHYRGAPARARRGMGATAAELAVVEERSRARAAAVDALRSAVTANV